METTTKVSVKDIVKGTTAKFEYASCQKIWYKIITEDKLNNVISLQDKAEIIKKIKESNPDLPEGISDDDVFACSIGDPLLDDNKEFLSINSETILSDILKM